MLSPLIRETFLSSLRNQTHSLKCNLEGDRKSSFLHVNLHNRKIIIDYRARSQIPPWKIWNCDLQHCRNSESHPEETTLIAKKDHVTPERLFFSPSEEFIPCWYCMPSYAIIFKDGKKISPCRTTSLIPPHFYLREHN